MTLVVTKRAARKLDTILAYIAQRNPGGARNVHARISALFRLVDDHPLVGQETNRPGVRRLVATPYPYVLYYRVEGEAVIVQRIRHGARRPVL